MDSSSSGLARIEYHVERVSATEFLQDLGLIDESRPLLIHSSFRSLKPWGADTKAWIVELADIFAGSGLLIPTFTGRSEDGPLDPPRFDPETTACWTGILPETARKHFGPGARSLHPTHSFLCLGGAEGWKEGHETFLTPCGPGSPLVRLAEENGQVLLAGCGLESLTLVHAAEEAAEAPYVLQSEPVRCNVKMQGGWRQTEAIHLHSWATPRAYEKLEPGLREAGLLESKTFGSFIYQVIQAGPTLDLLTEWIRTDPGCVLPDSHSGNLTHIH